MSEAVQKPTKVSRDGVILIKSFEGFRPRAVSRADGRWVIGYGHTASARVGAAVSESDAELLLQYDLIPVVQAIRDSVTAPLNQHQFDALASFAFSVGVERFRVSDVLVLVNAGRMSEAATAMTGWHDEAEAHQPPRRRSAERALFTAPEGPVSLAHLLTRPLAPFPALPAEAAGEPLAEDVAPFPLPGPLPGDEFGAQAPHDFGSGGPLTATEPNRAAPVSLDAGAVLALTEAASPALVLAPANDAIVPASEPDAANRVVWDGDQAAVAADAAPSPTDTPAPTGSAPARRGKAPAPGSAWPFIILGAMGMVAFGAAAAAFRRAVQPGSGDTGLVGIALALIAVACVVTAAYNLYQRWGRPGR